MTEPIAPRSWLDEIPQRDREQYSAIGWMASEELDSRAALVVVDVTLAFCGREGLSLDEAVREYSVACGPVAWKTMPRIAALISQFRTLGLPVVFTRMDRLGMDFVGSVGKMRPGPVKPGFNDFPAAIGPREGEWVLEKTKASAFFQTPLSTFLARSDVQSVVICGATTSGCVRASAVDAVSHGYGTTVVEDACFDRSYFAHCANLFDLHGKYATVLTTGEVCRALRARAAVGSARAASTS